MSTSPSANEPTYAVDPARQTDPSSLPYYIPDIRSKISPQIKHLLTSAYHIPEDEVPDHCQRIRDKAWNIRAYPCIGLGVHLQPPLLTLNSEYKWIVEKLKTNPETRFLDVGTFLGIEPRVLYYDGVPANRIIANDVVDFWTLGQEFFRDGDSEFIRDVEYLQADMMMVREEGGAWETLRGGVDVINMCQILHQFTREKQVEACECLVALGRAKYGTMIVGCQVGKAEAEAVEHQTANLFMQSPPAWKEMWEEIMKKTGTKWRVECELRTWEQCGIDPKGAAYLGPGVGLVFFGCERLE